MPEIKPKEIFSDLLKRIHAYDAEEAREIVSLILEKYTGLSKTDILINQPLDIPGDKTVLFNQIIERVNHYEPVQYILGEQWFRNFRFEVGPGVLIPRPETEELIEIALRESKNITGWKKVLDIGTGSGCIAISVAREMNQAIVSAVDISEKALETAKKNAVNNDVDVNFILTDILNSDAFKGEKFDIILSNPPYVKADEKTEMRKNVLDHEPELALFVSDDDPLLFYRRIAGFGLEHLQPYGFILVEINSDLGTETKSLFERSGYQHVSLIKDFFGKDRFILTRF